MIIMYKFESRFVIIDSKYWVTKLILMDLIVRTPLPKELKISQVRATVVQQNGSWIKMSRKLSKTYDNFL